MQSAKNWMYPCDFYVVCYCCLDSLLKNIEIAFHDNDNRSVMNNILLTLHPNPNGSSLIKLVKLLQIL